MRLSPFFVLSFLCLWTSVAAVWPAPVSQKNGTQVLWLSPSVQTHYQPLNTSYSRRTNRRSAYPVKSDAQLVEDAFSRFKTNVQKAAFAPWKFHARGATFEPTGSKKYVKSITVQQVAVRPDKLGAVDESYSLTLDADGIAVIRAATANGAMHGLTSLLQLFYASPLRGGVYTPLVPVSIEDRPVFAHRGLNLDIARNYQSPDDVKRTIDAMELSKFNVLHLHATDAQSWPIEIPSIPELAAKGAYAPGLSWSPAALADVQSHALARGIQTYIEIDSPGHTSSIAYSHPELITAFNERAWSDYCAEPPCGEVLLNSAAVRSFFDRIFADLLPRLKPFSTHFHTGGDELNRNAYALDHTVRSNDPSVIQPFLLAFVEHLHAKIRAAGLRPIVWEEMIAEWNLTLPTDDTLVQTWLGQSSLDTVTGRGYRALFGDYTHWYLDCGNGQWLDPNTTNSQTPIVPPYTDYCSPLKSWREIYSYDPTVNLTSSQVALLEGGEVHAWGELTDPVNLDSKLWPRASAAAEILWSGTKGPKGVDEGVMRRLADLRERLVQLGFGAAPVTMTWCLQNLGGCTL